MARRSGSRRGTSWSAVFGAVAVTAAVSVAATLVITQGKNAFLNNISNSVASVVGPVVSAPVHFVQNGTNYIGSFFGGAGKIRQLEAENQALLVWRDQARAMAERLDAYEQLHHVQSETLGAGITARVVAETAGPFTRAGVVNVGTANGVRVNWIVLSANGLVGRVISVSDHSARILLLSDSASQVPVMGEASRARAIVIGDKTAAPLVSHLNLPPVMSENERLMTSGDDGLFPRGLAVGTLGKGPDGQWRVRLASSRAPLDFVRLVPPSHFPPPAQAVTLPDLPAVVGAPENDGTAATANLPTAAGSAAIPTDNSAGAIAAAQNAAAAERAGTSANSAGRPASGNTNARTAGTGSGSTGSGSNRNSGHSAPMRIIVRDGANAQSAGSNNGSSAPSAGAGAANPAPANDAPAPPTPTP